MSVIGSKQLEKQVKLREKMEKQGARSRAEHARVGWRKQVERQEKTDKVVGVQELTKTELYRLKLAIARKQVANER